MQYTRNTVTGSSTADVIVLLVDARNGVVEQTRRHLAVASLLRVPHVILVVNKIDLVDYSEDVFIRIATDFALLSRSLGVLDTPLHPGVGDRGRQRGDPLAPDALVRRADRARLPGDRRRHPAGRRRGPPLPGAARGPAAVGRARAVGRPAPRRWTATTAATPARSSRAGCRSARRSWCCPAARTPRSRRSTPPTGRWSMAVAGQSVVIRLDADVDVSRGDILAATDAPPAPLREVDRDRVLAGRARPDRRRPGARAARHVDHQGHRASRSTACSTSTSRSAAAAAGQPASTLSLNDIGRVRLALASPLPIDSYREHRATGAFIIVDEADGWTLGAGMAGPTAITAGLPAHHHDTSTAAVGSTA